MFQPRIIKNEDENEIFLEIVESLLYRENLTLEEDTLLELLVKSIDRRFDKIWKSTIAFLSSDLKQARSHFYRRI
ncbi:MAG: hypothetical protein ACRC62_28660 [Microcoleus sp.]